MYIRLFRGLMLVVVGLLAMRLSAAGDTVTIRLDLTRVANHSLHVSILTPRIAMPNVRWILPANVPGAVADMKTGKLLSNLKVYARDHTALPLERLSLNEYLITQAEQLGRIEYDIHDSWHYDDPQIIIPQIGTSFVADRQFLLNFHAIVGYLEGYEGAVYRVEIERPASLYGYGTMMPDSTVRHQVIHFASYLSLIDNPLLYTRTHEQTFYSSRSRYHICITSESDTMRIPELARALKAVVEAADSFCGGFAIRDYFFLFTYVDPSAHQVKSEEDFGAVEHSTSSVYFLPENGNRYKTLRELQLSAAHELMHLYEPLQIKTDATNKLNLRAKMKTSNIWLYEGFTEYLSLLMLYRHEVLTEQEYITEIRNKMSLSQHYEPYSLVEQSERCNISGYDKGYKNFYQKGALMAMMLDLRLMKVSKGDMNLQSLLVDIHDHSRSHYVIKDDMVIPELVKYSYPEMQEFFDSYVKGIKPVDYNEYLSALGWQYTPQRVDTAQMYVNAIFRYSRNNKEVYATNISLDQIGLLEGDVVDAINGKKVTKENIQVLLDKYSDKNYGKKVTFLIRRAGKEIELTGNPLTVTKNQRNLITVDRELIEEKKKFRRRYAGGGLHKNRAFK
jgi:predicted metalloprotease with PDZ domain